MDELDIETIKTYQLDIIQMVHDFCEEHHIRYFLDMGTLIGAVRHNGYIPWDDDIDICMLRSDYETFVSVFNISQNRYRVIDNNIDSKYPYEFSKVVDTFTLLKEDVPNPYPLGINIDLFILDEIPNEEKIIKKISRKLKFLRLLLEIKYFSFPDLHKKTSKKALKVMLYPIAWVLRHCYTINWVLNAFDENRKKYSGCNSGYVAWTANRFFKSNRIFKTEWFNESIKVSFEDRVFNCPAHYDEYLSLVYGDYMKLPPVEEQVPHHDFKAYLR